MGASRSASKRNDGAGDLNTFGALFHNLVCSFYYSSLFFYICFLNTMATMFEAKGISMKLNDDRWLFKDVHIVLEKGDTLVLRGPSGAG